MRNLVRKPLPWMVVAECSIVAALVFLAWHLVVDAPARAVPVIPASSPAAGSGNDGGQVSPVGTAKPKPSARPVPPGLNVDAVFWRMRLADLNRGQAAFEALEWRLVHSAMDTAQRYVESVVIPAIARAERQGG
jgi:hypothetical protein